MITRPTILTPELIGKASYYLDSSKDVVIKSTSDGTTKETNVDLPSIEGLALHLGIHKDTLYDWESKCTLENQDSLFWQISDVLTKVRNEQARRLINGGLSGTYNSTIAKLLLSSKHDYVEKSDVTSGGKSTAPDAKTTDLANQALGAFINKNTPAPTSAASSDANNGTTNTPAGN